MGNSTRFVALGKTLISQGMGLVGEFEIHCPALLKIFAQFPNEQLPISEFQIAFLLIRIGPRQVGALW